MSDGFLNDEIAATRQRLLEIHEESRDLPLSKRAALEIVYVSDIPSVLPRDVERLRQRIEAMLDRALTAFPERHDEFLKIVRDGLYAGARAA